MTTPACTRPDIDPDIFTSTDPADIADARAVCATCPLTGPCLKAAFDLGADGIWAGTTKAQRQRRSRTLHRRTGQPLKPITHGTRQGYSLHRNRGETACDACKKAAAIHSASVRARKQQAVA